MVLCSILLIAHALQTDSNWRSKQKRSPSIQLAISTWLSSLPSVHIEDKKRCAGHILLRGGAQAAHKARRTFICLQSYLRPLWLHHFATTQRVCGIQVSASCFLGITLRTRWCYRHSNTSPVSTLTANKEKHSSTGSYFLPDWSSHRCSWHLVTGRLGSFGFGPKHKAHSEDYA